MAMSTLLQAVPQRELDALRRDPDRVAHLDTELSYATHFAASINYFLTGNAYPTDEDHALWPMLHGAESVACQSLENGQFGVVPPDRAHELAHLLTGVDVAGVAASIEDADLEDLVATEELYDVESVDHEEAPVTIAGEIRNLVAFYGRVAAERLGVVSYTT
jgi:hypothetical protein